MNGSISKFYGIGVGVGSSKAITVKAVEILGMLDVLYVPIAKKGNTSVAHNIVKEYLPNELIIKERHFPMSNDTTELQLAWNQIAKEIHADVLSDKQVGFVTIGDPMVYSTYIYLLRILRDKIPVETIPGITSFLDIASGENFPLVEGENPLVIVPATVGIDKIKKYLQEETSIVLMKVYKNFSEIIQLIKDENLEEKSIIVSNSSKENKQVIRDFNHINMDDVSYFTTVIINKGW